MTDVFDKTARELCGGDYHDPKYDDVDPGKVAAYLREKFGPLQDKVGDYISHMGVCEDQSAQDESPICEIDACDYCDMARAFQAAIGHPVKE